MDRLLYVSMTGAKHAMLRQSANANNLANIATTGFKADEHVFRALPVVGGGGERTRHFVVDSTVASDFTPGPLQATGRELDVAVQGKGWFAVQTPNGEAYIRSASLQVDATGQLVTGGGFPVLTAGGPISVPAEDQDIVLGRDGTITAIPRTGSKANATVVGQLKLVNPDEKQLIKGDFGSFTLRNGQPAAVDENVQMATGMLEGSNVNGASTLINLISAQRQFDMQIRLLQSADQNAQKAAQILTLS